MSRSRGAGRAGRRAVAAIAGLLAAAGAFAAPLAEFASPATVPVAQLRREFEARGTQDALNATATVVSRVHDASGKAIPAACRAHRAELARAARHDPLSLAVWYVQARCADALGDVALREGSEQAFAALLRDLVASVPPDDGITPMRVESLADGSAVAWASGEDVSYSYFDASRPGAGLVWRVGLRDPANGRERHLSFEFIERRLRLVRDRNLLVFPLVRLLTQREVAQRDVRDATGPPLIPQTLEYLADFDPPQRAERLDALFADKRLSVAIVLARHCFADAQAGCAERAVDRLLPFGEKRDPGAMVLLAYANANGLGLGRNEESAKVLLSESARREGTGAAFAAYFELERWNAGEANAFRRWAYAQVAAAADGGDRLAMGVALRLAAASSSYESDVARLQRWQQQAEAAGLVDFAAAWCRAQALRERDGAAAVRCAEPQALHDAAAAAFLAEAYEAGDLPGVAADAARALHWREKAATLGDARSMRLMGRRYEAQSGHAGSRERAVKWYSASMLLGDAYAMLDLAEMRSQADAAHREEWEDAVSLLEDALKSDAAADLLARARRDLAELLLEGRGTPRDPARARQLLQQGADAGDAWSQLALARGLYAGRFGAPPDPDGAKRWIDKAIASGDQAPTIAIAAELYRGQRLAPDRPRALALWQFVGEHGEPSAWNDMAWDLCTLPDAALRDPKAGLDAARKAVAARPTPARLDTQATCEAAAGNFDAAVATGQRALDAADPESDLAAQLRDRLALYRAHRAWLQPSPDADASGTSGAEPQAAGTH